MVLLVVILVASSTGALLSLSVVVRLAEALLFNTIFHIKAVGTTTLVTNIQLAFALVQAHARQVGMADISEHILQAAVGRIPDLDALWMRCDERVEDWVVEDAEARVLIGQVVIDRLIVVVENEGAATHDDALWWRSHG